MAITSREQYEQSKTYIDDLPRGAGDPDFYGYPGEPKLTHDIVVINKEFDLAELMQDVPF